MKRFINILILLIIFKPLHSQIKDVIDLRDTITIHKIENFGEKDFNCCIDAVELLNKQSFYFRQWIRKDDKSVTLPVLYSFNYKLIRNNKILSEGTNKRSEFLRTELGKLIYKSIKGDSIIIYDFKTSIDNNRNIILKPVSYKITDNSIFKYDSVQIEGLNMIKSPVLDRLHELYPTDGGCNCAFKFNYPEYYENKSKIFYRRTLSHYYMDIDTTVYKLGQEIIDLDFSFIYLIKKQELKVYDHLTDKEYSLIEWERYIEDDFLSQ